MSIRGISFGQQQFYTNQSYGGVAAPQQQIAPQYGTAQLSGSIMVAMQQLHTGFSSFVGGYPFVGGFEPQPVSAPPNPFPFVGGFQPQPVSAPPNPFPFVGGFQPQPVSAPPNPFPFVGGFQPQPVFSPPNPFPFTGGFQPQPVGFPAIPSFGGGTPLAGGGASLADRARMLQAGVSDSLIAGNIGFQTASFGSLASAQGLALAGPFASPFF